MTGAYIRVKRDGRWQNIEVDQLTDDELSAYALTFPEDGWRWARFLAAWIRDNIEAK